MYGEIGVIAGCFFNQLFDRKAGLMKRMHHTIQEAADMANHQNDFAQQAFELAAGNMLQAVEMKMVVLAIFGLQRRFILVVHFAMVGGRRGQRDVQGLTRSGRLFNHGDLLCGIDLFTAGANKRRSRGGNQQCQEEQEEEFCVHDSVIF